ncbi:methyl-accepting chemotaxis protein [Comamonas sp. w2-DMI]|uniref:methyl-accepting chemotaxis protein n=1 Tax=Comamonas sp. w2-DMI TaxID=3126391 RepID=UPI0032E40B1D
MGDRNYTMRVFENMKIGTRMTLSFGMVILLLLVVALVSIQMLRSLSKEINDVTQDFYVKVRITSRISQEIGVQGQLARDMLILHGSEAEMQSSKIAASRMELRKLYDILTPMVTSSKGKDLLAVVQAKRADYVKALSEFLQRVREGQADAARQMLGGIVRDNQASYTAAMEDFMAYQEELMNKASADAESQASKGIRTTLVLSVFAVFLAVFAGRALSRSVVLPVRTAVALAEKVAAGDLTMVVEVDSRDEIGLLLRSLQKMNQALVRIVSEVRDSAEAISTGSGEVASGAADLSQRTEEQAANLEETAASMEQLAAAVQQNATSSQQARQLAIDASSVAAEGGDIVRDVVSNMNGIAQSAGKVAEITQVIEGIAFQTNILSLNAAVEAARAGEQGRGFAVVAGEVRVLAHRSAEAAKEIKELISDSVERVDRGNQLVKTAGQTMEKIVAQVANVSSLITEISSSSAEQTSGIGQVSDAVQQLDQVTQQNAALVEESAASADSLRHLALRLSDVVASFRLPSRSEQRSLIEMNRPGFELPPRGWTVES